MKEVLHRRCACWRACVRQRSAVQRHFRRVMAGRRTAFRRGEYYFGSDQFDNSEQSGFAELETVAVLNGADGDGDSDDGEETNADTQECECP